MAAACVFCRIVAGSEPAEVVLDGEHVVGLAARHGGGGGVLGDVPRAHVVTLPDLPDELVAPFFTEVRRVAATVPEALGAQGTFVAMNNVVSQSVAHLHAHVVPRTKGDGLRGFFWPRRRYAEGEMAEYAARLRAALAAGS